MATSSTLQKLAEAVAAAAGWKKPRPNPEGVFVFRLEGGLVLELSSPDNRIGVLKGDLGPMPDAPDAEFRLARLAALAVGSMRKRGSVLSLSSETLPARLELSRTFDLAGLVHPSARGELPGLARDFLNDLAWWQRQTRGGADDLSQIMSPAPPPGWFRL